MKVDSAANDRFMDGVQRALDVMSRRQALIASNIGNMDTPGYKTVDLDFQEALRNALDIEDSGTELRRTHPLHLPHQGYEASDALARTVQGLPIRNDGNNVDLDREMLSLSETRARYEAAAQMLRVRLRQLRSAITEGRQ